MKKAEETIQEFIMEIDIELVQLNNQLSSEEIGWIEKFDITNKQQYLRGQKQAYFAALDLIVEARREVKKLI